MLDFLFVWCQSVYIVMLLLFPKEANLFSYYYAFFFLSSHHVFLHFHVIVKLFEPQKALSKSPLLFFIIPMKWARRGKYPSNDFQLPSKLGLLKNLWKLDLELCPLDGVIHDLLQSSRFPVRDILGFLLSVLEEWVYLCVMSFCFSVRHILGFPILGRKGWCVFDRVHGFRELG